MTEEMSSEVGRDAAELLQFFGFFHRDGILEEIFHRARKKSKSDSPSECILSHQLNIMLCQTNQEWNCYSFRAALSIRQSFFLTNCNKKDLISIHPLVPTQTRDWLSPLDQETIWTKTTSTVAFSILWRFMNLDHRLRKSLVPPIDACLCGQNKRIFHLRDIGNYCLRMAAKFAFAYGEAGQLQEALQLNEQVVEAGKRTLGKEHPDTLHSIYCLAIDQSKVGRRIKALLLTEQVVKVREKILGQKHPDTLWSMNNLAMEYSEAGRRQKALQLSEQVVEARKRIPSEEHPDTLRSVHEVATINDTPEISTEIQRRGSQSRN